MGPPNLDPAALPEWVYPLDGAIQPRNWTALTLRFYGGVGNRLFRVRFASSRIDYSLYFRPTCEEWACRWDVPANELAEIASLSDGVAMKVSILGTTGDPGGAVARGGRSLGFAFTREDVKGTLYYFSTSLPGIMRMVVDGSRDARPVPFVVPNSASNPKDCSGCHTVPWNAQAPRRIAATYGHGDDFLGVADGDDATRPVVAPGGLRSNFQSFAPDGDRLVTNFDGRLQVRDAATGDALLDVPPAAIGPPGSDRAAMPEWSHDGSRVVFVRHTTETKSLYDCTRSLSKRAGGDWLLCNAGDIAILPLDHRSLDVEKARVLVPAESGARYNYYPTWSPDDRWIVFDTVTAPGFSPLAQGPNSYGVPKTFAVTYDQRKNRLRMVSAAGGPVTELARATAGSDASWPKFGPIAVGATGPRLDPPWVITFSSHRDNGFDPDDIGPAQLWAAAIDPSKPGDPSSAAIWFPYQDSRESNRLAQWTGFSE